MTVTEIEEMDKKRVRVFIDGQFSFVLYKGELRIYKIKKGEELNRGAYDEIVTELLPKRAALRCMNLLKARPYTERQLRDKLKQGEYSGELIDGALLYVKSYGYVDDRKYAEDYIEYHMATRSRKRMEQDLMKKGIDRKLICEVLEEKREQDSLPDETSMALALLRKKNYDPQTASLREKQRLSAWLYGKGFGTDVIRNALLLDITPI